MLLQISRLFFDFFWFSHWRYQTKIFEEGKIKYEVKSRGIMDLFYPIENNYYAYFDTKITNLKSLRKKLNEVHKSSLDAKIDSFKTPYSTKIKRFKLKGSTYYFYYACDGSIPTF